MSVVVFPNCKINLGLRIIRKREDGYHDLETVFHPLPLCDVLEVIESSSEPEFSGLQPSAGNRESGREVDLVRKHIPVIGENIDYSMSGLDVDDQGNNLCIRAYQLLKNDFPRLPFIQMHLHKAIPVGAGLGGGSADAAFMLKLLNEKFNLELTAEQLTAFALQLGSDCPFFLINQTCIATGRGENLEPVSIDLSSYKIVLVNPGIHISTAAAFSTVIPSLPSKSIRNILLQPIHTWKHELVNDFEASLFARHSEPGSIKKMLYDLGAIYASMSGSGSTVYGIFDKNNEVINPFPAHYFYKELVG